MYGYDTVGFWGVYIFVRVKVSRSILLSCYSEPIDIHVLTPNDGAFRSQLRNPLEPLWLYMALWWVCLSYGRCWT